MAFSSKKNPADCYQKKGYTLLETLITIGLVAILSGIAVITYRSFTNATKLRHLIDTSNIFITSLNNCITSSQWKITMPDGTTKFPCKCISTGDNKDTDCNDTDDATDNNIFDGIGFSCPYELEEKGCRYVDNSANNYVCLELRKSINGQKRTVHTIVDIQNRHKYWIVCKDVNTYADLTPANCTPPAAPPSSCTDDHTLVECHCPWLK